MKLILASASPRRAEILRNAGFDFSVEPAHVDESRFPGERGEDYVRRLALIKAEFVAGHVRAADRSAIIIGADTVVLTDGQILGKPDGQKDARRMLETLSGKTHEVLSGLSVLVTPKGTEHSHVEITTVHFLELSDREIDDYLATGEPFDKAGAYGIQGIGGRFIRRVDGCYFNVMGLPLSRLWRILRVLKETDKGFGVITKHG